MQDTEAKLESREDIFWIHTIRAVAIVLVVVIHGGGSPLFAYGNVSIRDWWAANILVSISRVSVPLFFMTSGALLLGRNENLADFFFRRLKKLVLPLLFWSVFYILWRIWFYQPKVDFWNEFSQIIQTPTFPHLWFLYAMIGVYLTYPILRPAIQFGSPAIAWYFACGWFVMQVILPALQNRLGFELNHDLTENLRLFSGYVGYPVVGYLLGKLPRNNRVIAAMIPIAIISPIATSLWTFIYTQSSSNVDVSAQYYLGPTLIFAAISTFYLIRFIAQANQHRMPDFMVRVLVKLSKTSFGIYLVHIIFIDLMASGKLGFHLSANSGNALLTIPVIIAATVVASYFLVAGLQKIPFAKWVLP